jgi:hypothetical protein
MPISITCRCGYNISAPERLAGRTLRCPKCLGEFTVPQSIMPAPPPAPPPPIVPMPEPSPLAAFESAPTEALALEAAAPAPEPEATLPLMESPVEEPLAEEPLAEEPLVEEPLAMEPVAAEAVEPVEAVSEFGSSDLVADAETVSTTDDDALGFERGEGLPVEGEVPVMNEEELGLFLMDDEPAPEPKKKK